MLVTSATAAEVVADIPAGDEARIIRCNVQHGGATTSAIYGIAEIRNAANTVVATMVGGGFGVVGFENVIMPAGYDLTIRASSASTNRLHCYVEYEQRTL